MALKIASINIEKSNHLERLKTFLRANTVDVLLLQELCERDIAFFEDIIGGPALYLSQGLAKIEGVPYGMGLITALPVRETRYTDYFGTANFPVLEPQHHERAIFTTVEHQGEAYRIGTTHMRCPPNGSAPPDQQAAARDLIKVAKQEVQREGGLLLTGDFNAPRGKATFDILAEAFIDAVPAHYDMSLDLTLHRARATLQNLMVDGLFHTPSYGLKDVIMHSGISDHQGFTGTLYKAAQAAL